MKLIVNGEELRFETTLNVAQMLDHIGYHSDKVAIERNKEIVPKSTYDLAQLNDGDQLEIVRIIGGGDHNDSVEKDEPFTVAGRRFNSRLITGTGKYETYKLNAEAVEASECDIITVAVRRVNLGACPPVVKTAFRPGPGDRVFRPRQIDRQALGGERLGPRPPGA